MRGGSLAAVKELLGHKTLTMTLRYSHLSDAFKKNAVKLLDKDFDEYDTSAITNRRNQKPL